MIPYDTNGSWYTSGLRLGTPAVTTLGMGAAEMQEIAPIIANVLRATSPTKTTSGKPSLANYMLEEGARAQAEVRARDLLGRSRCTLKSSSRASNSRTRLSGWTR